MESLSDKLRSLGLVPARSIEPGKEKAKHVSLSSIIPGNELTNSLGVCYLSRTEFPVGYQHGIVEFSHLISTSEIAKVTRNIDHQTISPKGLFFLDTETTGLAGGTGTLVFLIGVGYQVESGFRVDQYLIRDPGEEPSMLLELSNFVEKSTVVSTFNGKAFDIPLLNSRYTLNRLPTPFFNLNHLDLLHLSRKLWKKRLASRSLQDLEAEILKIPRDENEVPGWLIPEIYFDYQRTGDPSSLAGVMYHNRMDILSLAALMIYIGDALKQMDPLSSTIHPTDLYSMGVIYNDVGLDDQAEAIFLACRNIDGLDDLFLPDLYQRLGLIYKRRADWGHAVEVWEAATKMRDLSAALELAKYFEHQELDYSQALYWTQAAGGFVETSSMQRHQMRKTQMGLTRREQRLLRLIQTKGEKGQNG